MNYKTKNLVFASQNVLTLLDIANNLKVVHCTIIYMTQVEAVNREISMYASEYVCLELDFIII